jgi:hypothetical protein
VDKDEGEIVRIAKMNAVVSLQRVLDQLITQCYVHESETQKKMFEAKLKMVGAKANVMLGMDLCWH